MKLRQITQLVAVLVVGFMLGSGMSPLHAEDPVVGEVLTVCINKKTGVLRVANKCTTAERKTVLGGVGARGEKGEKGDTGATGAQGDTGATGAQGAAGTNGINGAPGERGPQGERGLTGATGLQGPQGFTGATGAQGTMSGLSTRRLDFLSGPYSLCNGLGTSASVVGNVSVGFSGNLSVSRTTLQGCSVTVYAP
jgi:hypothetical protein